MSPEPVPTREALESQARRLLVFGEAAGVAAGVDSATRDDRMDQLPAAVEEAIVGEDQLFHVHTPSGGG